MLGLVAGANLCVAEASISRRVRYSRISRNDLSQFVCARGGLKKEQLRHLRTNRIMRKSKLRAQKLKCVAGLQTP
jgi:hypothetical protein